MVEFCEKYPDLVKFSERKIDISLQNNYYLDLINDPVTSLESSENQTKLNSLKIFITQSNFIDKFLTREKLINAQLSSGVVKQGVELNGVIFVDAKPFLPESLYIFCALREHLLGMHLGKKSLKHACNCLLYIKKQKRIINDS